VDKSIAITTKEAITPGHGVEFLTLGEILQNNIAGQLEKDISNGGNRRMLLQDNSDNDCKND